MTSTSELSDRTTMVVGASRGLGRGIATAFAEAGAPVITAYAREEASRAGLEITFTAVLPRITPLTDLGRPAVAAEAARSGQTEQEFLQQFGEPLTPEAAGAALVELMRADALAVAPAYLLTGAGLRELS